MKEILNEEMLKSIWNALQNGETYDYADDDMKIHITPNSVHITYASQKDTLKDESIKIFLQYCDNIDNDLFVEVCESFPEDELEKLQNQLDTDAYQNTIITFTNRVKSIANKHLTELTESINAEIKNQEAIIENAKIAIDNLQRKHNEVVSKYSIYLS